MSDNQEQDWVRLIFVDVFGASHAVVLPAAHYDAAVAHGVPFDGSAIEGRARHLEADMLLLPEPSTLRTDGPAGARVCCTVTDRARRPWLGDPRTALVAMIETFELASVYRAAAELEFYLLDEDGAPVDRGGYFGGLNGPGLAVTQMAAERLADNGIDVIGAHLEAGPGQYELDLAALESAGPGRRAGPGQGGPPHRSGRVRTAGDLHGQAVHERAGIRAAPATASSTGRCSTSGAA